MRKVVAWAKEYMEHEKRKWDLRVISGDRGSGVTEDGRDLGKENH